MDKELLEQVKSALAALTPPGSRFSVDGYPAESMLELTCDGADEDMGYYCCLAPGHDTKRGCYSAQKKVDFKPRSGFVRDAGKRKSLISRARFRG